ncbi:uncharacterized protein LOC117538293 [Gymnodraco acuticeps]|uniref:Uncharacterized protein LOC117538293 n=1 Tax=Gymnodraco acuticeps TaxID=8218 RepID=A0A6P8T803_GYMAC|nr:uncharacterized protein LOC117538293 [Gymnodraco acuticeps]
MGVFKEKLKHWFEPQKRPNREKIRAASLASSYGSTMSDGSMDSPPSFKRSLAMSESEEEIPPFLPCLCEEDEREDVLNFEDGPITSSPEEMRAASPAPSCVSMMSDRSMRLPVSFKRPASCESVKSDQSMGPPFKRSKFSPEEEEAVSPASSCDPMKSDRSIRNPLDFQRDRGINAGPWTDLDRPGQTWTPYSRCVAWCVVVLC